MAVFLRLLLGFWVLGEEAGVLLAYEFFCGTLTVTCEGRVERSTYSHTRQVPTGPLGDNSPCLLSPISLAAGCPPLRELTPCLLPRVSPKAPEDIWQHLGGPFLGFGYNHSLVEPGELR